MNPQDYILFEVDEVVRELENKGYKVELINNNYNVIGDTKLVTNIVILGDVARIYYGEFIFNLEERDEKFNKP